MPAYYNEFDPYAAQWLRSLIAAGHIAPGDVDERSIEDVHPIDLRGYAQCHFFAGIGVWSLALRRAGWADNRPVWSGSCPCQPFSTAGAGAGFADERHLWPAFFHLIEQCRPPVIVGEQVASKVADPWIDLVSTDLEALGYGVGAVAFPSAGVGAPHIRDRTYWVGHANLARLEGLAGHDGAARRGRQAGSTAAPSVFGGMADAHGAQPRFTGDAGSAPATGLQPRPDLDGRGALGGLANACSERVRATGLGTAEATTGGMQGADGQRERIRADVEAGGTATGDARPGPVNGYWRAADWLLCRDGKWRPVEPGSFPLVASTSSGVGRVRADQERLAENPQIPRKDRGSRVGRLRGYGNAINAQAAQAFVEAVIETTQPA